MDSAKFFLFLHLLLLKALQESCHFPLNAGNLCGINGLDGICLPLKHCPSAVRDLWKGIAPQICKIQGSMLTVCCTEDNEVVPSNLMERLSSKELASQHGTCKPLYTRRPTSKVGAIAWNKCIEYLEDFVFPCVRSHNGRWKRQNQCSMKPEGLVVDGDTADRGEFPFMAMLGFHAELGEVDYRCGAFIISDRFLLTAGHCIYYKGQVAKIKVGIQNRTETVDPKTQIYDVSAVIRHHHYRPPSKYHDIALVKTDRPIIFSQYVRPICLHTGDPINDKDMTVLGWGSTSYNGPLSDSLLKAKITKFTYTECKRTYPVNRHMRIGLDAATQVCYGDRRAHKDSCAGDSGGPILHQKSKMCTYFAFGVTSWGKRCGNTHTPGVYMKIAPYIGWIEKHVWP